MRRLNERTEIKLEQGHPRVDRFRCLLNDIKCTTATEQKTTTQTYKKLNLTFGQVQVEREIAKNNGSKQTSTKLSFVFKKQKLHTTGTRSLEVFSRESHLHLGGCSGKNVLIAIGFNKDLDYQTMLAMIMHISVLTPLHFLQMLHSLSTLLSTNLWSHCMVTALGFFLYTTSMDGFNVGGV